MARILLARHGETAWNALGMLQGHTDIPLNEVGRAQARWLADALAQQQLTSVCTSDLARANETGAIVATALGLAAPDVEPGLRERRFGVFEGLTRAQCATQFPEQWRAWQQLGQAPPQAEGNEVAVERFAGALARLMAGADGTLLVVSHGGVMRLWLERTLGEAVPVIGNGTTYQVEWAGPQVRVQALLSAVGAATR